jgi:hypothetical protein
VDVPVDDRGPTGGQPRPVGAQRRPSCGDRCGARNWSKSVPESPCPGCRRGTRNLITSPATGTAPEETPGRRKRRETKAFDGSPGTEDGFRGSDRRAIVGQDHGACHEATCRAIGRHRTRHTCQEARRPSNRTVSGPGTAARGAPTERSDGKRTGREVRRSAPAERSDGERTTCRRGAAHRLSNRTESGQHARRTARPAERSVGERVRRTVR